MTAPKPLPAERLAELKKLTARADLAALLAEVEQSREVVAELVNALETLRWKSIDKDNMEFECRTTCYEMDKIRAALTRARALRGKRT